MSELVKLAAPEGATSVTWMEKEYKVIKGFVRIEAEAVTELFSHGFGLSPGRADPPVDDANLDGKNPDDKNPDGSNKAPE